MSSVLSNIPAVTPAMPAPMTILREGFPAFDSPVCRPLSSGRPSAEDVRTANMLDKSYSAILRASNECPPAAGP